MTDPGIATTRTLSASDFNTPLDDRYFEDYQVGAVYEYGYARVTEESIVRFAEHFDPQPIHVDPEFAATGPFHGLIASGWHSASVAMRLLADHYVSRVASLASPGVDEVRWDVPLRPGDSVRLRASIAHTRTSRSRPDRGIVHTHVELLNEGGQCPVSFLAVNFFLRRDAGTGGRPVAEGPRIKTERCGTRRPGF